MKNESLTAEAIVLATDMASFFLFWLAADIEWYWAAILSTLVVQGSWWWIKHDLRK